MAVSLPAMAQDGRSGNLGAYEKLNAVGQGKAPIRRPPTSRRPSFPGMGNLQTHQVCSPPSYASPVPNLAP